MKIKISTIYILSLYAALIGQACVLLGMPLRINSLVSFGVAISVMTNILSFTIILLDRSKNVEANHSLFFVYALAFFGVIALACSSSLNVAGVRKLITFLQLPIYFLTAKKIERPQLRELIYKVNLCYPIMFALFFNASFSHRFVGTYSETTHENITLGYNNPNEAGIYLMLCLFVLISAIFHYKTIGMRLLCIAEVMFVGYLLVDTECRIAIALVALVILITLLCKKVCIGKTTWNLIMLIPMIYVAVLLAFPILAEWELWGSKLDTGRNIIYSEYVQNLTLASLLFGDFGEYGLGNMHNAYVSVFASLGIFAGIAFLGILFVTFKNCCNISMQKKENIALLLGLMAIIIHSSVETPLLVSGSVYAMSMFLLYYLYVSNDEMPLGDVG